MSERSTGASPDMGADTTTRTGAVDTAQVVVIGGGIMGCSIAYHLTQRGVRDVVLVERNEIASGSTSAAAGGIRLQFSSATNIHLSQRSLEVWEHFEELFGVDIGLKQQGYLFLLTDPADLPIFRENLALQQQLGAPVRWMEPDDIRALNPFVRMDDVLGGTFCPADGWADTSSPTAAYMRAARDAAHGARILRHTAVTGIDVQGDRVRGVTTSAGYIATESVVIAAGAYSREVGALAGVEIPIDPVRRMSFVTGPFPAAPGSLPMTIDFSQSLYFHPEGEGFLFGKSDSSEAPSHSRDVDQNWMLHTVEALAERAPVFETATVMRGWAGSYEVTPDHNAIVGSIDAVEGLHIAAGFSGHGFMHGPAIGMCMAELLTTGSISTIDLSDFSPNRFREERQVREHNVI